MSRNKRVQPINDIGQDTVFVPHSHGLNRSRTPSRPQPHTNGHRVLHSTSQRITLIPNFIDNIGRGSVASSLAGSTDDSTIVGSPNMHEQRIQSSIQQAKEEIASIKQQIKDLNQHQASQERHLKALESQLKDVTRNRKGVERVRSEADYETAAFSWDEELETVMEQVFGIRNFRLCQRGVCNAVMDGRDVFCVMPTGGGKSLTYQLPALLQDGCTLVVSPLLALISDQVHHLRQLDIEAVKVTSRLSEIDKEDVYRRLNGLVNRSLLGHREKEIKLCYATPELICQSRRFQTLLNKLAVHGKIARIVIDEAHCVSELGHDFRQDYSKLHILRESYPKVPILALSATCTPQVLTHVIQCLGLRNIHSANSCRTLYFASPLYRKNLHYTVLRKPEEKSRAILLMAQFIMDRYPEGSGIVYCLRKKEAEEVARELINVSDGKIKAGYYHAGKTEREKEMLHTKWREGDIKVVCATIAFGLGINKGDVRFVLHYSMSKSVECYYQESGRAGRDGNNSDCILYYRPQDVMTLFSMNKTRKDGRENVLSMIRFCEDLETCRKIQFARHLSGSSDKDTLSRATEEDDWRECGHCDNCNRPDKEKKKEDLTQEAWKIVQVIKSVCEHNRFPTVKQLAEGLKDDVRLSVQDKKMLIVHLLTRNILQEKLEKSNQTSEANVYIIPGSGASTCRLFNESLESLPRNIITYAFIGRPKIPRSPKKKQQTTGQGAGQADDHSGKGEAFAQTLLPMKREKMIGARNKQRRNHDNSDEEDAIVVTPPRKKQKCAKIDYIPDSDAYIDDETEENQSAEESKDETRGLTPNTPSRDAIELSENEDGCIISYMSGEYLWSHSMCRSPRRKRLRREEELHFVPDSEEE